MKIRDAVVGGAGPADLLIELDYGQLEMYVMAMVSGCEALADTLRRGIDVHARTAGVANNCAASEVTKEMRRAAKPVNFSLAYGATAPGIAAKNGIAVAQAQKYVDGYYAAFPGVATYHAALASQAKSQGRPTKRRSPAGLPLKEYRLRTAYGKSYAFIQESTDKYPAPNFSPTKLKNWPVQGLASDIIRLAMAEMWRVRRRLFGQHKHGRVVPAVQVHDSNGLRGLRADGGPPTGVLWPEETEVLKEIMRIMIEYPEQWLRERGLAWPDDLPLRVGVEVGRTWGQIATLNLETNDYDDS